MKELAFSEKEYRRRFEAVRNEADRRRIDYLLITEPAHFCWISGFNPSGLFYKSQLHIDVKTGECAIVTHRMEENLGLMQSWVEHFLIWHHGTHNPIQMGIDHARKYVSDGKVVGMSLKSLYLPVSDYYALRGGLGNIGVVDVTEWIDDARMLKSEEELEAVRKGAQMAGEALKAAYGGTRPGVRESAINAVIQEKMAFLGSEYSASQTFLSSGPRTGLRHALPSDRVIEPGDLVKMEIMGVHKRYHASIVRTVVAGKASPEIRKLYGVVRSAYEAGLAEIAPGKPVGGIDRATRAVRKEYSEYIAARSGFGVELGYPPTPIGNLSILHSDPHTLEPGMTFTLEPSISGYKGMSITIGNCVIITGKGYELLFDNNVDLPELG